MCLAAEEYPVLLSPFTSPAHSDMHSVNKQDPSSKVAFGLKFKATE